MSEGKLAEVRSATSTVLSKCRQREEIHDESKDIFQERISKRVVKQQAEEQIGVLVPCVVKVMSEVIMGVLQERISKRTGGD